MIKVLRPIPIVSITAIENCELNIHIDRFELTGGYRMVSPETQEFYDLQDQIVAKQAQVNSAPIGATRLNLLNQLEALRALSDSLLVRDEGECKVVLRYEAINPQGIVIPFSIHGLQDNYVFYVSDMASIVVTAQDNDYLTMREKAKRYILDKLKSFGFLGLSDSEYELA